ncbi:GNAT family N-acetyltransferase [Bradyrhizobium sp. 2S1]|uniref:GNAT family N-acetyltransferase n=1 Tax=Bradyrhizobium sp. 2S1 TaxID=1404429 RepID=UPI0039C87709
MEEFNERREITHRFGHRPGGRAAKQGVLPVATNDAAAAAAVSPARDGLPEQSGPGYDPLVYEHEGSVVGFIGVAGRRFTLLGQTYTGTLHSNFVVHPAHRGRGVGGALFRAYLELPRDFAFVDEVGERNRPLHERLGMTVSMAQSVRWILPLRPVRRLASLVTDRMPKVLRPVCLLPADAMDAMLRHVPRSPYRFGVSDLQVTPMSGAGLASLIAGFPGEDLLRPDATDGSIEWLVERARSMQRSRTARQLPRPNPGTRMEGHPLARLQQHR